MEALEFALVALVAIVLADVFQSVLVPRPTPGRWRPSSYAGRLNALAKHWALPPAQWIGDRSYVRHAS